MAKMVSKSSMLWLAIAAMVVTVAVSIEPATSSTPPPPPPSSLISGNGEIKGVGDLNGTSSSPPTLCGSLTPVNATGCGYLTPNPNGNITLENVTVPVNVTTPLDPINLP